MPPSPPLSELLAGGGCRAPAGVIVHLGVADLCVVEPWAGERRLTVALYAGARYLAREMGVEKVLATYQRGEDHPDEAGYLRTTDGWQLDATQPHPRKQLPEGGLRRVLALWGMLSVPFSTLRQ